MRTLVLFHVGSGQVRAAVATITAHTSRIIYQTASYVPFFDLTNKERYEHATLATLLEVSTRLSTEYLSHMSRSERKNVELICVFSSPWFAEATRSVTLRKKTPFMVTRSLVTGLQEQEQHGFIETMGDTKDTSTSMTPVENALVATQLDGYTTSRPYDRQTHELRATFHITLTTETLMKRVTETLSPLNDHAPVRFASSTFTAYRAVQKIFPEERNLLQVVISGECTDISIVEDGILIATQTFPYGTRSALRDMAQKHNMNFEEAMSRSRLYLSERQALRNDAAYASFQKSFDAWRALFTKAAHELYMGTPLPHSIVVIAEEAWQQKYAAKLSSASLAELTLRDAPCDTIIFSKSACDARVSITYGPDISFDTHIVADIVGIS